MTLLVPNKISKDEGFIEYLEEIAVNVFKSKVNLYKCSSIDKKIDGLKIFDNKFNSFSILYTAFSKYLLNAYGCIPSLNS